MSFNNIIGQDRVISFFQKVIVSKRLANAYIFAGPEGIGKKLVAKEFAKSLNCKNIYLNKTKDIIKTCDNCVVCKQIETDLYPEVTLLQAEGASISITDIKDIQKKIQYKYTLDGYRFVIIDDAEKMTQEASNCFLKTLEETSSYTIIILITSSISRILRTIISRCQVVRFKDLQEEEKLSIISKNSNLDMQKIKDILYLCGGNIKHVIEFLNNLNEQEIENFLLLEKTFIEKSSDSITQNLFENLAKDKKKFKSWINFMLTKQQNKNYEKHILADEKMQSLLQAKQYLDRNVNLRLIWTWLTSCT